MQIELTRQGNGDASSIKEWRDAGGEGVHHVCVVVNDFEEAKRVCVEAYGGPLFNAAPGGVEWMFFDTHGGPGSIIEISHLGQQGADFAAGIREAARGWDGKEPVRHIDWSSVMP